MRYDRVAYSRNERKLFSFETRWNRFVLRGMAHRMHLMQSERVVAKRNARYREIRRGEDRSWLLVARDRARGSFC